ncbi:MAG TPA: PEP-CTERM sorting domain-containing protein [Pirellulales bacterium]|nr:PEP-CTERM sorting domain-containing protein [Pirellulales bacterium]
MNTLCYRSPTTRRVTIYLARMLATAIMLAGAPVFAQLDTAANSDPNSADDLGIPVGNNAILNLASMSPANDVDFFSNDLQTGEVFMGMTTPIAGLPGNFGAPDTILKLVVPLPMPATDVIFSDNDLGSELPGGANRGSLFRFVAPMGNVYPVGISGAGDLEFDGANTGAGHAEMGDYLLTAATLRPSIPGGDFGDTEPNNDTSAAADLVLLNATGAAVSVVQLEGPGGDVDFFALPGLKAGQVLSAMTAPVDDAADPFNGTFDVPNTVLGLFDGNGLLLSNDDAGDVGSGNALLFGLGSDEPLGQILGSALRAVIPQDGNYFLAVSGFDDLDFDGLVAGNNPHGEIGNYALLVSVFGDPGNGGGVVPEPTALGLASLGLLSLAFVGWRKRRRA